MLCATYVMNNTGSQLLHRSRPSISVWIRDRGHWTLRGKEGAVNCHATYQFTFHAHNDVLRSIPLLYLREHERNTETAIRWNIILYSPLHTSISNFINASAILDPTEFIYSTVILSHTEFTSHSLGIHITSFCALRAKKQLKTILMDIFFFVT